MKYALIVGDKVINTIELSPQNAYEFPNAVSTEGYTVGIGCGYINGQFTDARGVILLPREQQLQNTIAEQDVIISILTEGVAVNDLAGSDGT